MTGQKHLSRREHRTARRNDRRWSVLRRVRLAAGAAVLVLIVTGAVLIWPRATQPQTVAVGGMELTSTLRLEEIDGQVYAFLPVNSDLGDVVLKTGDPTDDETIRAYIDGIDVFVPGEHVIGFSHGTIRLIVDGIAGEG